MIVYICPKCGGNLQFSVITTYPPIQVTKCYGCGWREEKRRDEIERIPYKTNNNTFDKIKAEIEALPKTYPFVNHINTYVKEDDVKMIIDKYNNKEVNE